MGFLPASSIMGVINRKVLCNPKALYKCEALPLIPSFNRSLLNACHKPGPSARPCIYGVEQALIPTLKELMV